MPTECEPHAGLTKSRLFGDLGTKVGERDRGTASNEQFGGGDSTPGRTDDGDALAAHGERRCGRHLSFNVVRLNSAKMIATMMNRVITFGSLQPISSKW